MFNAGDLVLIVSCKDDPRAAGRTGWIVDELPPNERTEYRWTVRGVGFLIGNVLCETHQLRLAN